MNIKYIIAKNEMPASSTDAKYLGRIIPNGVRNRALMTANALKSEHFAEATFNAVIDAALEITQELCAAGRDVDWGPVKFLAKMHGSMPCEDSAFEDGTASLTLDADATNPARDALATLVPVKVSAAEIAASIKVSNIMDETTEQFGVVIGSTIAVALGNGITFDADGEYIKALDPKTGTVVRQATIVSVSKGQRARFKFDPQLPAGNYTLELATKGLVGESTPRIFRKPVTAVYVPPPTAVTGINQEGRTGNHVKMATSSPCEIVGTGLALNVAGGDKVLIEQYADDDTSLRDEGDCTGKVTANTATKITLSGFDWEARITEGEWCDQYPHTKLVIVKNGVRTVFPFTFDLE